MLDNRIEPNGPNENAVESMEPQPTTTEVTALPTPCMNGGYHYDDDDDDLDKEYTPTDVSEIYLFTVSQTRKSRYILKFGDLENPKLR